jgi:hypothetical protein
MKNYLMLLLITIIFESHLYSSTFGLFPHRESLDTSEEVYALCIKTNSSLVKDDVDQYDKVNKKTIINRLCTCTTPYVLDALNKSFGLLFSCLKNSSKDSSYPLNLNTSITRECSRQSDLLMKADLNKMYDQCEPYQRELNQLLDMNKACFGDYCNFISNHSA